MNKKAEHLIELLNKCPPGDIIEIGGIREPKELPTEGFSTYYFALECKKSGRHFISCEIEEKNVKMSRVIMASYNLYPEIVNMDGAEFLKTRQKISMLYLDSSRFPGHTWAQFEMADIVSGGIVAIDDAHEIDGHPWGKAQHVVEYLNSIRMPFNVIETEPGYRMIDFVLPNGKKGSEIKWE